MAEVNQAFDSFQSDYDQARATYFASISNQAASPSSATTAAFMLYTTQRVSLLAQQLISSFIQTPQGTANAKGQQPTLSILINRKIIGGTETHPAGSLANALLNSIPTTATSAPTMSLYTLSQDSAIESARVAVLNGLSIIKNMAFGNPKVQQFNN